MTAKRVMLIVMCVLLVTVIIMTGITVTRFSQLLRSILGSGASNASTTPHSSSATASTNPQTNPPTTQPTVPATTVPTLPPTTQPTEPGHEHDYVLTESVEATCENYGYQIYTCTVCGKQDIPLEYQQDPLGHNFGAGKVTAPTCTEEGYTRYTCSRCGKTETDDHKAALGHDFVWSETVVGTCTEEGYDLYCCSHCGLEEHRNVVTPVGHTMVEVGVATAPTCTSDGVAHLECSVCGYVEEQIIPALGHELESLGQATPPTCTTEGVEEFWCSRCGETVRIVTPALGHSFGEWVVGADGIMTKTCQSCAEVVSSEDFTVTDTKVSGLGESGRMIVLYVGTAQEPQLFCFTICDYLNNGTTTWNLDAVQGLVVTYTDTDGTEIQKACHFTAATTQVDIPAG